MKNVTPGVQLWSDFEIDHQLIHFVLTGREEFRINEHVFHLKAGDAFLIPAGKITYYEASKQTLGLMHGSALSASARKVISIRL